MTPFPSLQRPALSVLLLLFVLSGCTPADSEPSNTLPDSDTGQLIDAAPENDTTESDDTSDHDTAPQDDTDLVEGIPSQITTRGALFHGTIEAGEQIAIELLASRSDTVVIWFRRTEDTSWHPSVSIERTDGGGTLVYHNPRANVDAHIPYRAENLSLGFEFYNNGPYTLVLENTATTPGSFEFSLECLSGPCNNSSSDPEDPVDFEDLRDDALRRAIRAQHRHNSLGYSEARREMFTTIDNYNGQVECIYTGTKVTTSGIPANGTMNTEHTWPQSKGAKSEPKKSDLHHLFPSISTVNSRRSNHDFGVVVDATWSEKGSKLGKDANGQTRFEPRDASKGNIARAMFYFAVIYDYSIDADQEAALRAWHIADPVDDIERARNDAIANAQRSRNPFVDNPELVSRISDF